MLKQSPLNKNQISFKSLVTEQMSEYSTVAILD